MSAKAIEHRLRVGRLRRLHAGVYAVGHEAVGFDGRALAGVMSAAPGAAASHRTAAALWSLVEPGSGPPQVTATASRRPSPGLIIHRAILPDGDLDLVRGVPVTGVPRTLLDLSATKTVRALRRLVKQAEFMSLTDVDELAEILARYPFRRGRRTLAQIVECSLGGSRRTRSELEDRFLEFCRRRRLPPPETNVTLEVRGRRIEVDCLWRDAGVAVELDGYRAHGTRLAFEDDRARDRALAAAGWTPIRITWTQLHHEPALAADLRVALTTGARRSAPIQGE